MSEAQPQEGVKPVSLEAAKVVHVDREEPNRNLLEDTLRGIGFRHIAACENLGQFAVVLGIQNPDLIFIDMTRSPTTPTRLFAAFATVKSVTILLWWLSR